MSGYNQKASKFLSYILRHKPEAAGIVLDINGWANIDDIIANSKQPTTEEEIIAATKFNDKKRFELDLENRQIRAVQGHSVKVEVEMTPFIPEGPLFHGTVEGSVEPILKEGLRPQTRLHVHLSKDVETASSVGSRRGRPVILEIDARKMRADNLKLMESKNGVILCDEVPPGYIKRHIQK